MPQNISSIPMNTTPIRAINVNLSDWGHYSSNPIEVQYDSYTQIVNINIHRALYDVCVNQHATNNAITQFPLIQHEVALLKEVMNEWKDLITAYHTNETVRKTIDQAKLVAGIIKDDTDGN